MAQKDIIAQLKGIVAPYVQNDTAFENFSAHTNFITDLEINSANLVDIVLDVEDAFDIMIDNDSMDAMLTVENAVTIIEDKKANL